MTVLLPLGGSSQGNTIRMYSDGSDAFEDMWAAIDEVPARVVVWVGGGFCCCFKSKD
jgi:hypothetical protein